MTDILNKATFDETDAEFLIYCGAHDEAEKYLLKFAGSIDGDRYSSILPLAEAMEKQNRHLVASLLYRALIDSILTRAKSKYYPHGVRYYEKLQELAPNVNNWKGFSSHTVYLTELKSKHGRKPAFWTQVKSN